jgi:hypothetical protein
MDGKLQERVRQFHNNCLDVRFQQLDCFYPVFFGFVEFFNKFLGHRLWKN